MNLQKNRDDVFATVEQAQKNAHRPSQSVNVIAVTKYVDSSIVRELIKTGIHHIGENRVDKFLDKYHALSDQELTWHLIGTRQRRKVKDVSNYVDYFHALDSVKLAEEINKRAEKPIKCFLQLNISGEQSKHGFSVDELEEIIPQLIPFEKVEVVGLMTMAPFDATESECNDIFGRMKKLQVEISEMNLSRIPCTELSMGMSRDYEIAIKNGATFVRIGTEFFKNL